MIGELDVSVDTGTIYVCLGKNHAGTPEWIESGLDLRFLHQQVHMFQPKHDTLPQSEKEELYWLTNMLLYLERRYQDKSRGLVFQPSGTTKKLPRF